MSTNYLSSGQSLYTTERPQTYDKQGTKFVTLRVALAVALVTLFGALVLDQLDWPLDFSSYRVLTSMATPTVVGTTANAQKQALAHHLPHTRNTPLTPSTPIHGDIHGSNQIRASASISSETMASADLSADSADLGMADAGLWHAEPATTSSWLAFVLPMLSLLALAGRTMWKRTLTSMETAPLLEVVGAEATPMAKQERNFEWMPLRMAMMAIQSAPADWKPVSANRPLRVAVIGGGPSGACAADTLAQNGVETFLIERKMDNCKPCGGAIPLCMVEEFDIPEEIIDRKVTKMKMISPSNREVDVGRTLSETEYIGMCRREVFDDFLRNRAKANGATLLNGLMTGMEIPNDGTSPYTIKYNDYSSGGKVGTPSQLQVDVVIGADGANSRVAKAIGAGDYDYAIAFQERVKLPDAKMKYYEDLAEMYVGDDVSPDFYGWVFPKSNHVAVGTGTVIDKTSIKKYQQGTRDRSKGKCDGGSIIRVEAHPIPEHPRPMRTSGRAALVGDAAGYVTKCSGEGIYFAAKSGRMCAEAIAEASAKGTKAIGEPALRNYLDAWDRKYWATYKVLDILQKVFYRSNPAREAFVEMCKDDYVQKMTFDSYLYKTVVPGNPLDDLKLLTNTVGSILRANALRSGTPPTELAPEPAQPVAAGGK